MRTLTEKSHPARGVQPSDQHGSIRPREKSHENSHRRAGRSGLAQDRWRAAVWVAGLAVAVVGATITSVGGWAVAHGAGVPAVLAGGYPAITDGLALTAYTATAHLPARRHRAYAWAVVVCCAGLSAAAQAVHIAQGAGVGAAVSSPWLRAGVGGWPAIAVAVAAHLVWLVGSARTPVTVRNAHPRPAPRTAQSRTLAPVRTLAAAQSRTPPEVRADVDRAPEQVRNPEDATGAQPRRSRMVPCVPGCQARSRTGEVCSAQPGRLVDIGTRRDHKRKAAKAP